jgi:hypothetical protein
MNLDTIRRPSTMNLDTIRRRHAASLAAHTQDRERATAVAARTPAAGVVDTHRTATADIRPTLAEDRHPTMAAVHHPMAAEAAIATHTQAPVHTTAKRRPSLVDENRKSDGQPTVAHFALKRATVDSCYQTPLSLPVNLNATAAADASGGSRLRRNVAGTLPLNAAWVICFV